MIFKDIIEFLFNIKLPQHHHNATWSQIISLVSTAKVHHLNSVKYTMYQYIYTNVLLE